MMMVKLNKKRREQYTKFILESLQASEKEKFREALLELHPSDQSDVFMILDQEARSKWYCYLPPNEFAIIFIGLNVSYQKLYFLEMEETYATDILNNMFTDDIANFLTDINSSRASEILFKIEKKKAKKVRVIISHE